MKFINKITQTITNQLFPKQTVIMNAQSIEIIKEKTKKSISKDNILQAKNHYVKGFRQYELGNLAAALVEYNNSLAIYPTLKNVHFQRSLVLIDLGRTEEAFTDLQVALQQSPNDPTVLLTAGWVSLSLNKLAIARTQLLQAWTVRDASITSSIAINLGHISLIEKNRAEAIQWYQKGKDSAEDVSLFYKELRADYESLSLSEKQITLEAYQLILKQFKCNDSE